MSEHLSHCMQPICTRLKSFTYHKITEFYISCDRCNVPERVNLNMNEACGVNVKMWVKIIEYLSKLGEYTQCTNTFLIYQFHAWPICMIKLTG